MTNLLKNNGYHVLGFDTSASQKEILKRSKDLLKFIQIEDIPHYDLDLGIFENFRTEENVKDALQKLTSPKKQIKDYFFWFNISDNIDEQALGALRGKDPDGAIRIWEHHSQITDSTKGLFYKKNLAILYCVLLYQEDNPFYLSESLKIWHELTDSPKFWNAFSRIYKLNDELNVDQEVIDAFQKEVVGYISDIYTELGGANKNNEYISAFSKIFGLHGQKIETEVLNPIYKVINQTIEKIENLKLAEGNSINPEQKEAIKKLIASAQAEFNKIIDLGLYDSTQVKVIRDRFSEGIRVIVLDLHNKLSEYELAKKMMEIALVFCGTEGQKSRLSDELKVIEKHVENEANNTVTFEIPSSFSKKNITFTNNYVEYGEKRIFYADAVKTSWCSTKKSINGIPSGQSYSYWVSSEKGSIDVSFSATFRGGEQHNNTFSRIVGISQAMIEPVIVKKIVSDIFDKGLTVDIGSIHFNNRGYSTNKFFGGINEILWSDVKYKGNLHQGSAFVFSEKNGKSKSFASAAMSNSNAVIIPELVDACLIAYSQHVKK